MKQAETLVAQVPQAELMDEQQLNREVTDIEFQAEAMVIQNDEDYAAAGEFGKLLKQKAAQVTSFFKPMTDTLMFTLNDPEVMGKDVFGHARLKKVLEAWGRYYDKFFDALTLNPEADYARAKMDEVLKRICGDSGDFIPFEERYDWLPEIRYGHKQ
jgi:predicted TIM-barrel fold metal-dependent hydrolase